ncbi:hypothetical protein [Sodalinema gerasimenkoae]|uniref:hypothetical protein n=1 Tax=Sodalinema gerasimenkoae TaxID=2862348 RepID=UPI00135A40FB|nr:hypothetical protein [Sodalinema gerasimenkoae]
MSDYSLNAACEHLKKWIENFLDVSHPHFGGLSPCPFSRQAWITNRVDVQPCQRDRLESQILEIADRWSDRYDVCILANLSREPIPDVERRIETLNPTLAQHDVVALVDSPRNPATSLTHTSTSNHKYLLILLQRLSHLQTASQQLEQTGYYDRWTAVDFENLVDWRSQLLDSPDDDLDANLI